MTEDWDARLDRAFEAVLGPEHVSVSSTGGTFVLIPRETLAGLQRAVEEVLGRGAEGVLVRAAYTRGRRMAEMLADLTGGDPDGFAAGLRVFGRRTGQFRLEDWRMQGGTLTVHLAESAIGRGYGTSERPVCHYLRGTLLAFGEQLFRRTGLECRETGCVAMGAPACVFVIQPALVMRNPEVRPPPAAGG